MIDTKKVYYNRPKLELNLDTVDGNAYSLLAHFKSCAKRAGWHLSCIDEVLTEAKKGDYDHLVQTLMRYDK